MMDKTIKINLGGTLFQIDEEAYNILRRYLQDIDDRLKNTQGGPETIEDIELRIAEIFQSQGGAAGVISKENVEAVISVLGEPKDFDTSDDEGLKREANYGSGSRKKLYRNPDDVIIGGVCSGLGAYLNIAPVWVRLAFIFFACFFGAGFLVYLALWIALPKASSEARRKEMYGSEYYAATNRNTQGNSPAGYNLAANTSQSQVESNIGNAFNEVFRAIGRVLFICLRIFLILVGLTFVITGFIALVSFVMIFFFKYPGYFSTHSFGVNIFYLPDFLNYVVNPAIAPWILFLSFIVVLMPLIAMIYWGVKMIFWFRAKDGIVSLIALVIWVISITALSLLSFNEGINYSETARSISENVISKPPKELYIRAAGKVADLHYDKDISFDDDNYDIFFIDDNKGLFIRPNLRINSSDDNRIKINVIKRSAGRSKSYAISKAESLLYNYNVSADTLYLDEYFSIPAGNKWSLDNVIINLNIPQGTTLHLDKTIESMYQKFHYYDSDWGGEDEPEDNDIMITGQDKFTWIMTERGLRREESKPETKK